MSNAARARLRELFQSRAISHGRFTLASGKESTYYIDSKKVLFNSEAVSLLGEILWDMTKDMGLSAIGGLEVGAIPMATAACLRYQQDRRELEGFFVRKQTKGHGSQRKIEGCLRPGERVAVVDDVLTSGASALQAAEAVEHVGAEIKAVICIVDRLAGARELLSSRYLFLPIFTIRDFGIEPEEPA